MTKIFIDPALSSRLTHLSGLAQLCDPTGRVLGQFIPQLDMADWEPLTPDLSEEELRRREQETESYSTAELRAYLERLKCSGSNEKNPLS